MTPPERDVDEGVGSSAVTDEARPIPDAVVRRAIELLDTSGILEVIDGWRAEDRRGPGGRPETFGVRPLLVSMLLCALGDEPLLATRFTEVLFERISPTMRVALGVPEPPASDDLTGWRAVYRNTRTRLHGLLRLMDPSANPKNRRLPHEQFEALCERRRAGLSDTAWGERYERLTWFVNGLLEMSFRALPRDIRRRWKGSVAVDATVVPAFARHDRRLTRRSRGEKPAVITHSADPDADWYTREKTDPNAESGPSQRSVWGFEASFGRDGSRRGQRRDGLPEPRHRHGTVAQAQPRSGPQRYSGAHQHP